MNISVNIDIVPDDEQFRLYKFLKNKFETKTTEEILKMGPRDFLRSGEICQRTYNLLKSIRVESLLDLSQYSRYDFPRRRGFGKGTLREIENLLNKYGLEFSQE